MIDMPVSDQNGVQSGRIDDSRHTPRRFGPGLPVAASLERSMPEPQSTRTRRSAVADDGDVGHQLWEGLYRKGVKRPPGGRDISGYVFHIRLIIARYWPRSEDIAPRSRWATLIVKQSGDCTEEKPGMLRCKAGRI